ncbi:PAS domain S-box protein [Arcobacter sp. YIC-464]|uniref:PAS domain S-box protein n=1 Tax=Arcobacter sp. YIC-464 TaxID=3376631 RepID=UPI003C1536AF
MKKIRNLVIFSVFVLISVFTYQILTYQKKIYQTNKNYFNKTIFQEAQTHFEYFKIFRAWNSKYNGVFVKEEGGLQPNKYLVNNQLFTSEGERLIKINPAWMTKQISEMMNSLSNYNYKITSLKPVNPDNKAFGFEVEALNHFEKNPDVDFYTKLDKDKEVFNFMGKLTVKESCLQCHGAQGYELGQTRGGIRVTIPLKVYEENIEILNENYKYQRSFVVLFAAVIFLILYFIIDRIYKNQVNLKELKNKYKILYDRYDYAVTGSNLGLWDWNLKTNEVYFSKIWKKMLGYEDDELPNLLESWDDRVHPDDKQKAVNDIKANQEGKTEFYENIHRLKHKDGSWIWILDKGKTVFDKNGNAIRMLGVHADITKIQELKQELTKLKLAIEHSPISIVITNKEGSIEYVNPHFTQVTGYSLEEAIGNNPRILKSELTTEAEYKKLWEVLTSKKTWRGTFKNINKNKKEFWESAIITPILDNNDEIVNYLAIKQEITQEVYLKEELKNKEEMMIAQSRHAAMGEMISMIAHQWRQPISVIAMAANNTLADIALDMVDNDELKDNTESMLEQTKYLSQTIEDFRDFFRPNKEKEKTTCKKVLDESLKIMGKALENNEISLEVAENSDVEVMVYSRELLQVYLNILKNAKEALVQNRIDNRLIEVKIFKVNDKTLRTTICDNAGGVPTNIIGRLFEPYFSTKDEKSGTGLGLYMCKTIVEKHFNGEIGVFNGKEGACFYVDLPIS